MKKLLTIVLFIANVVNISLVQGRTVTAPLHLTSDTLHSLPPESFSSYQHIVVEKGFDDGDLKTLGSFSGMRILDLYPAMDVEKITNIPTLDDLQKLNLSTRKVSDFDIEYLITHFKKIQVLDLSHTGILGKNLGLLSDLECLTVLNLSNTFISDSSCVADLSKKLPSLKIYTHGTLLKETDFVNNSRVIFKEYKFD